MSNDSSSNDSNVALVQSAYADFQKGDIARLLDRLADDIVWTTPYPIEIVPHGGVRIGKAAVLAFFEALASGFEITKFDPSEFVSSGDRVVALVGIAGRARGTGVAATSDVAHLFRIRGGKICELREYGDAIPVVAAYAPQTAAAHA